MDLVTISRLLFLINRLPVSFLFFQGGMPHTWSYFVVFSSLLLTLCFHLKIWTLEVNSNTHFCCNPFWLILRSQRHLSSSVSQPPPVFCYIRQVLLHVIYTVLCNLPFVVLHEVHYKCSFSWDVQKVHRTSFKELFSTRSWIDRVTLDRALGRAIVFCSGLDKALYSHSASSPPCKLKGNQGLPWHAMPFYSERSAILFATKDRS